MFGALQCLVLLASILFSPSTCRSLCRPSTGNLPAGVTSANVSSLPPSPNPSTGFADINKFPSNNNSMMMPSNLPSSSGNGSSFFSSANASENSSSSTQGAPNLSFTNSSASNNTGGGPSYPVGGSSDNNASSTPASSNVSLSSPVANVSSAPASTNSSSTSQNTNDTSVSSVTPLPNKSASAPPPADKCLPFVSGVNMAGLEFGMDNYGTVNGKGFVPPPLDQVDHFIQEKMNIIRFPIGWQYVQPKINGELNATYLEIVDKYIKETTPKNAYAILDLHNFARLDGKIVGQDLPAAALVDLWTRLAKHYKDEPMLIFGLMNEPHEVEIKKWIDVLQQVVTAIRKVGAQNIILLPGTNWCHLKTFADDYSAGISSVKNPDGSKNGLLLEIHQYFDADESGTNKECTQDHIDTLTSVAEILKKDGRQAIVTEMGGGNSDSCKAIISKFVKAVASNYPSIAGSMIWGAGSFAQDYTLVVTVKESSSWKDQINFETLKSASFSSKVSA